ncbi:hypothetical protein [Paraburkholderia sediminicola]|uniref:hypothetical protein n=1 Tax=Paraburkholderia sediminicola TaxID=458836 RepID=UPI0038BC8D8F
MLKLALWAIFAVPVFLAGQLVILALLLIFVTLSCLNKFTTPHVKRISGAPKE